MTVTLADLTDGTRIRHIEWEMTGVIREVGGVTQIRWDGSPFQEEISPEGPVFPADVEIIQEES